jgi:hypothetical protein
MGDQHAIVKYDGRIGGYGRAPANTDFLPQDAAARQADRHVRLKNSLRNLNWPVTLSKEELEEKINALADRFGGNIHAKELDGCSTAYELLVSSGCPADARTKALALALKKFDPVPDWTAATKQVKKQLQRIALEYADAVTREASQNTTDQNSTPLEEKEKEKKPTGPFEDAFIRWFTQK